MGKYINKNVQSYNTAIRGQATLCDPHPERSIIFPVRVYDAKGNLKKTISVKKLKARPMEEGHYGY